MTLLTQNHPAPIQTIYDTVVKSLPPAERLKLAALILNDIPEQAVVDYSTEWSDDDLREFSAASFNDIEQRLEDKENASAG